MRNCTHNSQFILLEATTGTLEAEKDDISGDNGHHQPTEDEAGLSQCPLQLLQSGTVLLPVVPAIIGMDFYSDNDMGQV